MKATSTDGSSSTQSFTINVGDVDEFDVGAVTDTDAAADAVQEGAAADTLVGIDASATDGDATNNTVSYSLVDGSGNLVTNGPFKIDATSGVVSVRDGLLIDREAGPTQTIIVKATSTDGSSSTQSFTINVGDVDEFDVGAVTDTDAAADAVQEGAAADTLVGIDASATDGDATNNTVSYSLVDGSGNLVTNGPFKIDATSGVVSVRDGLLIDREAGPTQTIIVKATSTDGSFSDKTFTFAVNDVNEFAALFSTTAPDSDTATNTVHEGAAANTLVGITASADDADLSDTISNYEIVDAIGNVVTNGPFQISSSGVVSVLNGAQIDYERRSR